MSEVKPDLGSFNPFDLELLQDPYDYFERCRNEAPVFRDPKTGMVYISTFDLATAATEDWRTFSNAFGVALSSGGGDKISDELLDVQSEKGYPSVDTMLTADPPEQTRYRKLAMKAFNYKRVSAMGNYCETVTNEIIDTFIKDGHCEYKAAFASQLPMWVVADQLGVPRADRDKFRRWSDAFIGQLGGLSSREEQKEFAQTIIEFQHYMAKVIVEKRENPTDDLISELVHATLEDEGDPRTLKIPEQLSIIQQILVAGNETTAHTLTAGVYYLLKHPEQMAALQADPSLVGNFVEEVLRFLSPTNNMWRVCKKDTVLGGVEIKAGTMCMVRFGSANRDEAKFKDAAKFDIHRENAADHMAFGHGVHTCIGAQLARKEMNTAFPIVLKRLKNIRLADVEDQFAYDPNMLLRGVKHLYVEFDA